MTCLRLILGDQLNARHTWFRGVDPNVVHVFMEVRSETDYVRHHAQKVLGIFAAMRRFADALQQAGHRVDYLRIGDERNRQSFADNLSWLVEQHGATRLERMEADEWRVEQALDSTFTGSGLPYAVASAEHFLLERDEAAAKFAKKVPRMEFFYRDLRRRFGILVEPDGEPRGGRWNFDEENRAKWPGDPPAPAWPWGRHDLRTLWDEIQAAGVETVGEPSAEAFGWPLTRREAQSWLEDFIARRLAHFGQFQDAISGQSATLFHAGLSFALNLKMLHPRDVIEAAIDAHERGEADLAATEGFVRQILGWREYVRGIYWARMPGYAELNALDATRPLPPWYLERRHQDGLPARGHRPVAGAGLRPPHPAAYAHRQLRPARRLRSGRGGPLVPGHLRRCVRVGGAAQHARHEPVRGRRHRRQQALQRLGSVREPAVRPLQGLPLPARAATRRTGLSVQQPVLAFPCAAPRPAGPQPAVGDDLPQLGQDGGSRARCHLGTGRALPGGDRPALTVEGKRVGRARGSDSRKEQKEQANLLLLHRPSCLAALV